MVAILVGDIWVEEVQEIKNEITRYFVALFAEVGWERPTLDGISFPLASNTLVEQLSGPFIIDELEAAVMSSDGNKAPGPDGYNFNFIKEFWDIIKGDVSSMFEEFFMNSKLPKGLTSYFLALVPKISCPQWLMDYHPISLLGCLYKILAKVLASRLKKVLRSLIINRPFCREEYFGWCGHYQ